MRGDQLAGRRCRRVAATVAALATLVGGCADGSGSDADDEPQVERLTEEAFVAQFGEECAAIGDELDAIPDPESFDELADQASDARALTLEGVGRLEAIVPPEELEAQVDEALDLMRDYSAGFEDLADAADAEDEELLDEILAELTAAQRTIGAKLRAAGGIECGTLTATDEAEDEPDDGSEGEGS